MPIAIQWTERDKQILHNNYGKINVDKISKLIPSKTIRQIYQKANALNLNSNLRGIKECKYIFDENFWSNPNQLNCYWAGIFAADACVRKRKLDGSEILGWEISVLDLDHMKLFLEIIKSNHPIRFRNRKSPMSKNISQMCSIDIFSKQWFKDLGYFYNILPNKTKRLAPIRLSNEVLEWSYIIGLIDGDGCIRAAKTHYNGIEYKSITLQFTSSSLNIVQWICNKIEKLISYNFKHNQKDRIVNSHGCKVYSVSGLKAAILIDYLSKFPVPKLARKWNQPEVLEFIAKKKQEFPHLFIN